MSTPMFQQYKNLKSKHKDSILLFRLGDFYEAFNEDAVEVSKILNITLTGRGKGENRMPMAGIPYHALDNYLPKLINAGKKVSIAEQITQPETGKLVEREITKIYTSGTYTDNNSINDNESIYILSLYSKKNKTNFDWFISYLDISSGDFHSTYFKSTDEMRCFVAKINPKEIIISDKYKNIDLGLKGTRFEYIQDSDFDISRCSKILTRHFRTLNLKGFGYENDDLEVIPSGVLIQYAIESQKTDLSHISSISKEKSNYYMLLDESTIKNLELNYSTVGGYENTLYSCLNKAKTSMGQRLLRSWILNPLINKEQVEKRLDLVDYFFNNISLIKDLRNSLSNILDIERIVGKIGTGSINARDLLGLRLSLEAVKKIQLLITNSKNKLIEEYSKDLTPESFSEIIELIDQSIDDESPVSFDHGNIIKDGFSKEIDELRKIRSDGKGYLSKLQSTEREKTGIQSLKIKFNKVFGYYIEISNSNLNKVPDYFQRKQTLVNGERFVTNELKEFEEKLLSCEEKLLYLEKSVFDEILSEIAQYIPRIQNISRKIAELDVFTNLAEIAKNRNYSRPVFDSEDLDIKEGRHPIIELIKKEEYIPNDLSLDHEKRVVILTGPNMSGKSTFIRQTALIALMAQIGSFVPAKNAKIPIFDRIFTRVGASDNISRGESTFMVEMNETANILNNATKQSLIILDEVGRGTSTYDGVAIAWSIVEYLNKKIQANTLFATHYHELIKLEKKFNSTINLHVKVVESGNSVLFTHNIQPGGMNKSYGIHVAKMAGVPNEVIETAQSILKSFENTKEKQTSSSIKPQNLQIELFHK